jgi:hypothetical protein
MRLGRSTHPYSQNLTDRLTITVAENRTAVLDPLTDRVTLQSLDVAWVAKAIPRPKKIGYALDVPLDLVFYMTVEG